MYLLNFYSKSYPLYKVAVFTTFDNDLLCYAHSKGARVVLSAAFPVANLTNEGQRRAWVRTTAQR